MHQALDLVLITKEKKDNNQSLPLSIPELVYGSDTIESQSHAMWGQSVIILSQGHK